MSTSYAFQNQDPSIARYAKVDREGKPYQSKAYLLGAVPFETTQTLVPAVAAGPIPALAIASGWVQITGAAGAVSMSLPSMASTPAATDLIQLINSTVNMDNLSGVSNSTAGASATGPIRGFRFFVQNLNNGTVTLTAPGDASITMRGTVTVASNSTHECQIHGERASTGVLTYVFTRLG